ncbi:hypothetical protein BDP27DRAFT_48325 [Rhodocollybia butyracea]|uniref:F-box domain-containing protein n=1 Tax=Rhodocollybia butyracea TaxID=206335 RepID=A0A9P5PPE0_9AGAR|nr:hypothetical protein BDP27DRAFT_48325 [Rhodocollybia butyracea]
MALESCSQCHSTVFKPRVNVTSDVYEHLRSTNTLPENILPNTSALLLSIEKDLDDYESEIHALQIRIADIEKRRTRLRTHAENLQSLLSPIRRLPNELLMRVFGYACIENELTYGCGSALTLGSVCLRWRQLTIECPELWSNMNICIVAEDEFDEVGDVRLAARVNLYLGRSKSHPLRFTLISIPWRPDSDDGSDNPIFKQIARQSFRWKHVSFRGASFVPDNYPTWDSLDLPILDTLNLSSYGADSCSLEMLKKTPMLRAFHAPGMDCLWHQGSGFPLPSARTTLRDLEYNLIADNFYEILDNCSNLHRLSLIAREKYNYSGLPFCWSYTHSLYHSEH